MAKVQLDRSYLLSHPDGRRVVVGPGEVDDSEIPEKYRARLTGKQEDGGQGTPLPRDFPGRKALVAEGYSTLEDLEDATHEELVAIDGIGERTAEQILLAAHGKATTQLQQEIGRTGYDPAQEQGTDQQGDKREQEQGGEGE